MKALLKTSLPERAVEGFRTCGLRPFDPSIFNDADFEAALMTNEQMEASDFDQQLAQTAMSLSQQQEVASACSEANRRSNEEQREQESFRLNGT